MNILDLDHIGIAVRSIDQARRLFVDVLGGRVVHEVPFEPMKLRICKIDIGGTVIELLESLEGEEVVRKFLERRGEGIHHLCYSVRDIHAAQKELEGRGYKALWPEPRMGSARQLVAFLHPRDTHGVLIELTEAP